MPPNSAFSISAFYLICVPLRVSIAVWAWDDRRLSRHQPPSTVAARRIPAVAAATAISASFFLLTTGRLKRDSGAETGRIWWKSLRPVHGALWGSFAALKALQLYNHQAYKREREKIAPRLAEMNWVPLAVDAFIGAMSQLSNPDFVRPK